MRSSSPSACPTPPRRSGPSARWSYWGYWLVAAVYTAALLALTLLKARLSFGAVWTTEAHHQRSIDLELFDGFIAPTVWWAPWLNTLGNVALFLPFGVLIAARMRAITGYRRRPHSPLVGPGASWWMVVLAATACAAVASLSIETIQYVFSIGYSDIDDLAGNTLGAAIGAAGYLAVRSRRLRAAVLLTIGIASLTALAGLGASAWH